MVSSVLTGSSGQEVVDDRLVMIASSSLAKLATWFRHREELQLMELEYRRQTELLEARCCDWRSCLFLTDESGEWYDEVEEAILLQRRLAQVSSARRGCPGLQAQNCAEVWLTCLVDIAPC